MLTSKFLMRVASLVKNSIEFSEVVINHGNFAFKIIFLNLNKCFQRFACYTKSNAVIFTLDRQNGGFSVEIAWKLCLKRHLVRSF